VRPNCTFTLLAAILLLAPALLPPRARAADEIHWTMLGPTSVAFDWRGSGTTLRYGTTSTYGLSATGAVPTPLPFSSAGPFREARITGLAPGVTYHYSVDGGPDHTFHTMPAAGTNFTVYVQGDIGDTASYSNVGATQKLIAQGAPTFVMCVGDLTYGNANGQAAVDNHFNNVMKWSQDAAYMPAWGNHEWDEATDDFRNYKGRFALPNPQTSPGAPTAGGPGEDWYWFDAGNVRFIAYPEPFSGAWADWNTKAKALMDAAQADPAIRFIITFGHRPAYSSGHHPGDATLKGYMDALGAGHNKYVLNLNGHSHDYERTKPQSGVVHVTVGTGGASLEEDGSCLWLGGCPAPSYTAFRAFHLGTLRMRFTPTSIHCDMLCGPAGGGTNDITCTSGNVFDALVIGTDVSTDAPPPVAGAQLAIERVAPNPASTPLRVVFSLPSDAPASFEIVDVAGRRWLHDELGALSAGRHEATVSLAGLPGPGVFWLHLSQADRGAVSKVIVVR
jgi:hypothetical protein